MTTIRYSIAGRAAIAAIGASVAVLAFLAATPASAQVCAYNSTQASCACPTSGSGTTCFGGQLFRSTDNTCQNDIRPCAANQNFDCASTSCVCNTTNFPCGGCTAASSTPGATCSNPINGQYTNQCGACSCPSGTALCADSNSCVTIIACPSGTSFDPCTASCGTPNVLLSPGWVQSGFVQVSGDMKSTGGDVYLANGKALRLDDAGASTLWIGNWGTGNVAHLKLWNGLFFGGGFSTIPSDAAVAAHANGTIETGQLCLGNGVACRTTWPAAADFNPTYVNVSGSESMTGPLAVTGAGTNLTLSGAAGAAGTPKMQITAPSTMEGLRIVSAADTSPLNIRNSTNTADIFRVDQTGTLAVGSVPWARLTSFPAACAAGEYVSAVGSTLTCTTLPSGTTGSGTSNYVTKWTGSSSLGNSQIFDNGTNVGIGTATPGAKLDVVGTGGTTIDLRVNGRIQSGGSTNGGIWVNNPGSQFFGSVNSTTMGLYNTAWRLGVTNGGLFGFNTTAPTGAYEFHLSSATTTFPNIASSLWVRNMDATTSNTSALALAPNAGGMGAGMYAVHTDKTAGSLNSDLAFFTTDDSVIGPKIYMQSDGDVGIGTTTPTQKLDVNGTVRATSFVTTGGQALGPLPSGSNYQMLRHDGANWVSTSAIEADGTNVGIGLDPSFFGADAYKMVVWENTANKDAIRSFSNSGTGVMAQTTTGMGLRAHAVYGIGAYIQQGNPLTQNSNSSTLYVSRGYTPMNGFDATAPVVRITDTTTGSGDMIMAEKMIGGILTDVLRLTDAGNLGIGTAVPAQKLDVNGTAKMTGFQLGNSATAGHVLTANASGVGTWQAPTGVGGSGSTNYIPKFTAATTLGNSPIYVNNSNNQLGIGTTSTNADLHISDADTTNANQLMILENRSTGGPFMVFRRSTPNNNFSVGINGSTENFEISNTMALGSGTRMVINTSGNVGIGTASPGYKIDVSSSGDAANFGSGSSWFRMWTGGNSRLSMGDGAGSEAGFIAGGHNASTQNVIQISGCSNAGSCPAYTTFHESGRVGIGNDNPSYSLDVSGDLRTTGYIGGGGLTPSSSYGIRTQGSYLGGEIRNTIYGSVSYPAYYDYGIYASGTGMGGYFYDSDNGTYAYNAYGGYSFYGYGTMNNRGDVSIWNKHAFRGSDSWLRLNQDSAFTSGTHTPGLFAPGSLNVGGWGGWGNPGAGMGVFTSGIATGGHTPYSSYGIRAQGSTMGGYFNDTDGEYAYIGYSRYSVYGSGELRGAADNGYSVYIGGDGAGTDVELGSHSYNLYRIGFWNTYHGTHMDLYARSYNTISTARYKEDIETLKGALDKVLNLRGVSFTWDEQRGGAKDIGFIAEEVEEVLPELVDHEEPDGSGAVMSLDYEKITAVLVEAVKEQQAQIEELKEKVRALESLIGGSAE